MSSTDKQPLLSSHPFIRHLKRFGLLRKYPLDKFCADSNIGRYRFFEFVHALDDPTVDEHYKAARALEISVTELIMGHYLPLDRTRDSDEVKLAVRD